ncbi:MAG: DUF599 domain-containing protein [Thermoplasmatota archaeon]
MVMELLDTAALAVFFGCVVAYAAALRFILQRPDRAKRGLLSIFYARWVERVANPEDSILAVQTMRNLIMSVTFLSSAMLILLGVLIRSPEGLSDLMTFTAETTEAAHYKMLLLFSVLLFSLSMFLLSLRQMVRFSILIGIPRESIRRATGGRCDVDASDLRTTTFLKATNRFTFGIRGIYYGVAVMLWFISPLAFMGASIIITALLIAHHDIRAPCPERPPV